VTKLLQDLPHIGLKLAGELTQSGIQDVEQLSQLGSLVVATRLQEHGFSICPNKLYALEGAIRGIRWHQLAPQERSALWRSFQAWANHSVD